MDQPELPLFTKPRAIDALFAVAESNIPEDLQCDRINIQVEESGAVAYRLHPSGGGDYVGGVVMVPQMEGRQA